MEEPSDNEEVDEKEVSKSHERAAPKTTKRSTKPKAAVKGKGKAVAVAEESDEEDQEAASDAEGSDSVEVKKPARGNRAARTGAKTREENITGAKKRRKQSPVASDEDMEPPKASQSKEKKTTKGCADPRASP